ncbi:MAG: hypothetical protein FJ145_17390 [Deltaproteobacteria bacterium]|nr:hypothetical protein [Deltaproteobacteria bacterium]
MALSGDQYVEWLDRELEPLRRETLASPFYDAWCSGKLSKEQLFQIMGQWYAYLKHIPSIMCAWIQRCHDPDLALKYIAYAHEEAPHPEYIVDFAAEIGRDPDEMRRIELIPEFTTPYFYYWLSRGHIVEIAAANNFGNERTNTRAGNRMYEAVKKYYPYPSLLRFYGEHNDEEDGHADLGAYVLRHYATTEELQRKATLAAKKSLQLKVIGTNGLYERFMRN